MITKNGLWVPVFAGLFLLGAVGAGGAVAWAQGGKAGGKAGKTRGAKQRHSGFSFSYGMSTGALGADVQGMSEELRKYFGAPADHGLLVAGVAPGSAAERAGVKTGDVIVEVAGEQLDEPWDIAGALADADVGDDVKLVVVRDKKAITLTTKLTDDDLNGPDIYFSSPSPQLNMKMHRMAIPSLPHSFGSGSGSGSGAFSLQIGADDDELRERLDKAEQRANDLEQRLEKLEKKVK